MVFRHPSEKSWSESQLGWWHSKLNGKSESKCSKPPTINRFETSIFPNFFRVGNHSINFTNTPMPGVFLMKLATPRCSKYQISISMKYIYISIYLSIPIVPIMPQWYANGIPEKERFIGDMPLITIQLIRFPFQTMQQTKALAQPPQPPTPNSSPLPAKIGYAWICKCNMFWLFGRCREPYLRS